MKKTRPNFFIVGAPKCGTTSLASWLDAHPNVFMSKPKEPYFFSSDIKSFRAAKNFDEYLALFASASEAELAVGEGSTTYLRSKVAIQSIEKKFDRPRYIVCLKNPVDMALSVYGQLLKSGRENAKNFEQAWRMQPARLKGNNLPSVTEEPQDLQYGEMCLLGRQLANLLGYVDRDRVQLVFLEDVKRNPEEEYKKILRFLGIPDVGWREFTVENVRSVPRSIFLIRLVRLIALIKKRLGLKIGGGFGEHIMNAINRKPREREKEIDLNLKKEVLDFFKEDIRLLAELSDRNLDHWMVL